MPNDLISRTEAKAAIEKVRYSINTQQYTDDSPAFAAFKIKAAGIVLDYVAASIEKIPAIDALAAAEGRQYDEHGQPVCSHCGKKTNRAYAKHEKLQCWNCGLYMPDLTSRTDAAQRERE